MGLPEFSGGAAARKFAASTAVFALAALFALAATFAPPAFAGEAAVQEDVFDSIIEACAAKHSVDPLLVKAVIWNESRFNPRATGASGEIGLMQLKSAAIQDWAKETGNAMPSKAKLYDPYVNIEIGAWFLGRAMRRWDGGYQCYTMALCEYNAGRSRAVAWRKRAGKENDIHISSSTTRRYVINVRDKYIEYSAERASSVAVRSGGHAERPQPMRPGILEP